MKYFSRYPRGKALMYKVGVSCSSRLKLSFASERPRSALSALRTFKRGALGSRFEAEMIDVIREYPSILLDEKSNFRDVPHGETHLTQQRKSGAGLLHSRRLSIPCCGSMSDRQRA